MPLLLGLQLSATGAAVPPSPEQLHAVACTLLDDDTDHHSSFKAFSVQGCRSLHDGCTLELGLIDDSLVRRLDQQLQQQHGVIRFGSQELSLRHVTVQRQADWNDLADTAKCRDSIGIRFITPTLFRRGSKMNLLPLPSAVFGHWRRRWNQVAGTSPHCPFDDREIHVAALDVSTHVTTYRGRPLHGITGTVVFDLSDLPPEHQAALDALAQLAPYAGCGSRTTAGFGVTEVFSPTEDTRSAKSPRRRP